ncbi:ABC transporter substrate-binding protein [Micromonospora sp. NPDC000442]|uniref:ABC transporter substrate-binding protein n=1 Tax=Micromonospora sp. NPDC000442 TaxID=3364217 RepID=UPI0036AD7097
MEADLLQQAWQDFVDCTGVRIDYEGSADFETEIGRRVAEGHAPDVAFFPQPGLIGTFARDAEVLPLKGRAHAAAKRDFSETWLGYGTFDGTLYATPLDANVKSLVWYSPKMFRDAGWQVPGTWAELVALSDTIAASGIEPWCAGIESGGWRPAGH